MTDPVSAMVGNARVKENLICEIFSGRCTRLESLARTRDKAIIRRGKIMFSRIARNLIA